ncbi:unnamed protein product [Caenorhabditis auriculariae]|uniref:Ornithine decarboxylase antizyme n=1 Tax=Caenorhabditis auriculariae TaxID=2777116 RepID=A0A8S1GNQ0_9PELO|nr:unnamed protein product [Caenorhabditis auriculariae]
MAEVILIFSPPTRRAGPAKADGVFDAPPHVTPYKEETIRRVKAVSPSWGCGMPDKETLVVVMPADQKHNGLSKEKFVDLLEFAEDKLQVSRVLAVFEKQGLSMTEGFPRTLRYVGFRVLSPEAYPNCITADVHFVMCYRV